MSVNETDTASDEQETLDLEEIVPQSTSRPKLASGDAFDPLSERALQAHEGRYDPHDDDHRQLRLLGYD